MPRYHGGLSGFYEVWFVEVQDDLHETGLWIRYILRAPQKKSEPCVAELWAMYYDKNDPCNSFGLKCEMLFDSVQLSASWFQFGIGDASIDHPGCRVPIE